jgi:hypothetical protein
MDEEERLKAWISGQSAWFALLMAEGHLWIGRDSVWYVSDPWRVAEAGDRFGELERLCRLQTGLPLRIASLKRLPVKTVKYYEPEEGEELPPVKEEECPWEPV